MKSSTRSSRAYRSRVPAQFINDPGSYVSEHNHRSSFQLRVVIFADGVTLDLNGFAGRSAQFVQWNRFFAQRNFRLRNGTIRD
jgi:hypothetical protein